ncbi:hypothetical protein LNTAR_14922 [Lentisphaera araneosa HTCC2155]|uniref:Uncharacterized protein n=1 Tax=Lentisphaera araneosa HTCC2155 TaxID=313628 RepID=A6DHN6_9BACT|nr:hypothetical protein [Lentisphaera araneosa]EDM29119.1 hypothetical protein LNTAR_14922 [Lentisphaera araneosa HTCC2155]
MNTRAEVIYHYKKDRKQRSKLFINMGAACWLYIAGLYGYEHFAKTSVPENLRSIWIISFSLVSLILFYIAYWHRTHPATYEAIITTERFTVHYPGSEQWSFDVKIPYIKRFEHRNTLSHAGEGIGQSGILLNDGSFHQISINYGNNLKKMHKAVQSLKDDVTFSNKVNKKVSGPLSKDYDK